MLSAIQLKLSAAILGVLLSLLGIVGYEHYQAEVERQRIERQRQAQQKFWKDLQRQAQDPRNHLNPNWSEFLRKH
jgi:predicted negative regulator of RcsB-dependent stress response